MTPPSLTKAYQLDEVPRALAEFASGKHGKLAVAVR